LNGEVKDFPSIAAIDDADENNFTSRSHLTKTSNYNNLQTSSPFWLVLLTAVNFFLLYFHLKKKIHCQFTVSSQPINNQPKKNFN